MGENGFSFSPISRHFLSFLLFLDTFWNKQKRYIHTYRHFTIIYISSSSPSSSSSSSSWWRCRVVPGNLLLTFLPPTSLSFKTHSCTAALGKILSSTNSNSFDFWYFLRICSDALPDTHLSQKEKLDSQSWENFKEWSQSAASNRSICLFSAFLFGHFK